jgi:hypothetical protein
MHSGNSCALAKATKMGPTIVSANDMAKFAQKRRNPEGNALVVGHGNTISNIVKALGITAAVTIPDNDYNELFLVTLNDKCQLVGLHYAF